LINCLTLILQLVFRVFHSVSINFFIRSGMRSSRLVEFPELILELV